MPGPKKLNPFILFASMILAIAFTACSGETQKAPDATKPSIQTSPTPNSVETAIPTDTVEILTIWIPTLLSPFEDTPEGSFLADRITAYEEGNPDISLQIRIKDVDGPAGLLESLTAASVAAPSALPDLIVLDPYSLNAAALKGLIIPVNAIYETPTLPTWYQHAIDSVQYGDSHFGIPFLSSTDVFAYRQDAFENPPLGWADLLAGDETFLFPGGEKHAAFTLAQYLALDGPTVDEEGQVSLQTSKVREILDFYLTSKENGLLPLSSLQYLTSNQTWTVLQGIGVSSAVVPLRTFLQQSEGSRFSAQPFPTSDGEGIVLTSTYSWSIVTTDPDTQSMAVELIDWLMQPEFLGTWAHTIGMLPATSAALGYWPSSETMAMVNQLVRVAVPIPGADIMSTSGPALQNAIEEVLFNRSTPNAAALMASEQVKTP
jgi:ABC-type glycerol-3-phosphate transport system substrate-binding protein